MKKRILTTGGIGFLGGHLVSQSRTRFHPVATYYQNPSFGEGAEWVYLDLTGPAPLEDLVRKVQPEIIIQNAARSNIDECEINHGWAAAVNLHSTVKLAEIAQRNHLRLLYVSSDMVYDGERGYYAEGQPVAPVNYYGRTKLEAEKAVSRICCNYVIARVALIYGFHWSGPPSFLSHMLESIGENRPVNLLYDQYRSSIAVSNLAEALLELANHSFVGVLNPGGSERINRYQFGLKAAEPFGFPRETLIPKSFLDFATLGESPRDISMNVSKAQAVLKTALLNCREGLQLAKKQWERNPD